MFVHHGAYILLQYRHFDFAEGFSLCFHYCYTIKSKITKKNKENSKALSNGKNQKHLKANAVCHLAENFYA